MSPVEVGERTTWETLFQSMLDAAQQSERKVSARPQQAVLGQSVIDAFFTKTGLVAECPCGTGKSFGYLIPLIHAVAGKDNVKRGVVSTETIALQDQIALKDLPFLQTIYPDFTFKLLKGRSNYVCLEAADYAARGNQAKLRDLKTLVARQSQLGDGERRDAERVLGRKLTDRDWESISGSTQFCAENSCEVDKCFSTRARAIAADADIVVVNHALLQAHIDSDHALLGDISYIVVDEAHSLEQVMISGWTDSVAEWELSERHGVISKGLDKAQRALTVSPGLMYATEEALDGVHRSLDTIKSFFQRFYHQQDWGNLSEALAEKTVFGGADPQLVRAMEKYEGPMVADLKKAVDTLGSVKTVLTQAIIEYASQGLKGVRDVRKGLTAAKKMLQFCELVLEAIKTKDGVVVDYGVPHGVIVEGYTKRTGEAGVRIQTVPLDVSTKLAQLWAMTTPVLISATLTDLTDGSFKYLATSLGLPEHKQLQTGSPFDYQLQQRAYITQAAGPVVDFPGARYNFDELVELINHAEGRSLVLFTSRAEMDDAASRLLQLAASGDFRWPVLVQTKDADKQKLVDEFRTVKHSVLLGSKGLMTGVDFPGDTCSLVVLPKFTLPRFDVLCRQQIAWWQRRGFPRFYEREALTVFQQAAGRLIRTGTDRGVVAILDQRVVDPSQRVFQTAKVGITALGSGVIRTPAEVSSFLADA